MLKALYYPHTDITNSVIIKNSLLLWDCIETIVPRQGWAPRRVPGNRLLNEAVDLVVRPRVPTLTERRGAHDSLRDFIRTDLPSSLIRNSPRTWRSAEFLVYPEKFLEETWHMLEHGRMAQWVAGASDYGVPPALGFLMMSILADSCAGSQIQKVTDRVDAYSWISEQHARALGSQYVTGLDVSQVAPAYDRLAALSLEVLDAREVPLRKLLEFRRRELRSRGSDYSAMRRHYLSTLQAHLQRLGKEAKSEADVRELQRQFKEEMKQDLADLKAELSLAGKKALLSKEVALSALILAGSLVAPVAGITALGTTVGGVGIIPLAKTAVEYRGARREVLRRHTMSWLFLGTRGRVTLF